MLIFIIPLKLLTGKQIHFFQLKCPDVFVRNWILRNHIVTKISISQQNFNLLVTDLVNAADTFLQFSYIAMTFWCRVIYKVSVPNREQMAYKIKTI